jgi:outer membrane protein OmpU
MKHTLLATTALVTMTSAAAADLTISATGRIGLMTTEGTAGSDAATTYGKLTKAVHDTFAVFGAAITTGKPAVHSYNVATAAIVLGTIGQDATATEVKTLDIFIAEAEARLAGGSNLGVAAASQGLIQALSDTAAEKKQIATDLATMQAMRARMVTEKAAVTAVADSTDAVNRFRISFKGSGETDGGISYGISGRAEQSNSSLAGTQHVSGAFGKIKMGDLGGADKDATGNISGVGLTGLGDHNEVTYQAATHNVGYEYSVSGLTFGYSQNTAVKTGSNSAMGIKYSGDMGGANISVAVGQSKVGTSTQSTMSVSASSGGLTLKAITSTNDNGPAVAAADGTVRSGDGTTAFVIDTLKADNNDTDTTGVSISYAMDAMTVTGFTKTVSTTGAADKDYSGFGFAYDMGGVSLKAGVVDNNDQQLIDFGLSFSF